MCGLRVSIILMRVHGISRDRRAYVRYARSQCEIPGRILERVKLSKMRNILGAYESV
jgi:hypothetical protein